MRVRRCARCQVDYPDALEYCPSDGDRLPPLTGGFETLRDPILGTTIDGRYHVESVLGEGGMGVVYAARHAIIDKRVAVKVLRKEAAADEASAERFLAEAKAASKIGQQHIVDITDFGVLSGGYAYFVMEFLDGPTLGKLMATCGPLPPARVVAIAAQVCKGLNAAHAKGIVHRDLKPENVFVLERDGVADFVKIVDFGIARDKSSTKRLTVAGMVMGTPEYMAPEQASGQETDPRVDQYSLGCIVYEMLTGRTPFRGENPMQTLSKHVFDPLVPPSQARPDLVIPSSLEAIVVRSLDKRREARFPDLDAMMRALLAIEPSLRGIEVPLSARPAVSAASSVSPSDASLLGPIIRRRRRAMWVAAIAAVTGTSAVATLALRSFVRPPAQAAARPIPPVSAPPVVPPVGTIVAPAVRPAPAPATSGESVKLSLSSQPSGAAVFLDDELLGSTPFSAARARSGQPLSLVFRKTGFKDTVHRLVADKDAYVEVVLPREPTPSRRPIPGGPSSPWAAPHPALAKDAGKASAPSKDAARPTPRPRTSELRNPFDDPPK